MSKVHIFTREALQITFAFYTILYSIYTIHYTLFYIHYTIITYFTQTIKSSFLGV